MYDDDDFYFDDEYLMEEIEEVEKHIDDYEINNHDG